MVSDKLESFDPNDHIILFRGKPYLECKWRLFWMRLEHPDWSVETEMIRIEDRAVEKVKDARLVPFAMFKATILDNLGHVIASSHGSETALDWGDYVEKAETKAIARALAAAGYGTIQSLEFDFDEGRDEKGEINLSDSPGPEVKPKTIDTSKQFGTPVKTTQPQVSSNHYKCSECGGEITGYKSTSGTVYSADDVVASTSKATGFPLCKQCYLKKTKPVDNKPTP